MRVRAVANELVAIYSVDALLAPVGLLAAFAAATEPWASLLVPPLLGLIAIFAREREARGATRSRRAHPGANRRNARGDGARRAPPPRALRRHRLPGRAPGRGDSTRLARDLGLRRLPRDDLRAALPGAAQPRRRHQRAARERRRPVRPPRSWPRLSESGRRGTPPSRDEAGGQPDTDPSSEHKLEPAIG